MPKNTNLTRELKAALYVLMRDYGSTLDVYKTITTNTDLSTGKKSGTVDVFTIRKAVAMPATTARKFFMGTAYNTAGKEFSTQGGEGWDGTSRLFMIQGSDLPSKYEWELEDWIVFDSRRYEVSSIEELDFYSGWLILGKVIKGMIPEQVHSRNIVSIADMKGETQDGP
jgi:hypothetical protein